MAVEILSKQESVGFLQQSKASNHWAAPQAASANFKTIQWVNAGVLNPNPDVQVSNINSTSQYGTHREKGRIFVDATSGLPTMPIAGIADKTTLAGLLAMAFQSVSESGITPYSKDFESGGITGLIDWATNGGYLFTMALKQQASADDGVILENALMNTLNLVWDLNARGSARVLQYNGTIIGNELNYEQTLNGTWTNTSSANTGFFNDTETWAFSTLDVDSVDYSGECVKRVELQINNNITSDCKTTGGKANQYKWAPQINAMIRLAYNSTTEKLLKDFKDGADVQFTWANDISVSADKYLTFSSDTNGGTLQAPPKIYDGDYLGIDLNVQLTQASDSTSPLTCTLVDTIDWGF